ncbi:hypothetical protein SAMN05421821_107264 [Mucilaginibacter lappiensis]|uniref:Uncharacterized protein n=1 Tax=Mucilaginibacter lappiensis TaxID=354630 RepID=A0A1N7B6Q9_9SPHI|nr:hypothetical protein [Mucilaginibacter lappiensis]MBB6128212.1 hypothetical protein [Mucilaginibacter lappiensis]SIR47050.1 hypothetical protein SAMN05421821_107264 [Mucilaginibacter lappiensis]
MSFQMCKYADDIGFQKNHKILTLKTSTSAEVFLI